MIVVVCVGPCVEAVWGRERGVREGGKSDRERGKVTG